MDHVARHQSAAFPTEKIPLRYRAEIDGLRALAILPVVLFHAAPHILPGGFIGVDVFFVISGYLITSIILSELERGCFSATRFYARRIRRLYPALLLVMTSSLVWGWFSFYAEDYRNLGKTIAAGAFFVANIVQWQSTGYFAASAARDAMLHLWSLGVEEQFYLIWPLTLLFLRRKGVNLLTVTSLLWICSFYLNVSSFHHNPTMAFYAPQTRFWELSTGSLLGWLDINKPSWAVTTASLLDRGLARIWWDQRNPSNFVTLAGFSGLLGLGLICAGMMMCKPSIPFPGWLALLPVGGATLILAAGKRSWSNRLLLMNPAAIWIGRISYPLYLWHWPLLVFLHSGNGDQLSQRDVTGMVALAFVLAAVTYYLVERPLHYKAGTRLKTAILSMLMVLVGLSALSIYYGGGLTFRPLVHNQTKTLRDLASIGSVYTFFDAWGTWRGGTCYSPAQNETLDEELSACSERGRPLVFLMGDSYAASLYPGLKALEASSGNAFGIAEFTNSNGPPLFEDNRFSTDSVTTFGAPSRRTLNELNSDKIEAIHRLRPKLVILDMMFNELNALPTPEATALALGQTADRIRAVDPGVRILYVGPVPHWNGSLKDVILRWASENGRHLPPAYSDYGLDTTPFAWDAVLRRRLPEEGILYLSATDMMCKAGKCLTRLADSATQLTAIDWGHLTAPASVYLFQRARSDILSALR